MEKSISFKQPQHDAVMRIAKKNLESFPDVVRRGVDKVISEELV